MTVDNRQSVNSYFFNSSILSVKCLSILGYVQCVADCLLSTVIFSNQVFCLSSAFLYLVMDCLLSTVIFSNQVFCNVNKGFEGCISVLPRENNSVFCNNLVNKGVEGCISVLLEE